MKLYWHLKLSRLAILFVALGLSSCVNLKKTNPAHSKKAHWKNIYHRDPLLAGVAVRQYSDDIQVKSLQDYSGKHPAEVIYYFWDGRMKRFIYSPEGAIIYKEELGTRITAGSEKLDFIDFSHGSDPNFSQHPDPRREVKKWKNLYKNDPSLAGIEIDQRPREGSVYEDRSVYDNRHPGMVSYYFWDGRIRCIYYSPYGDVWDDSWYKKRIKAGDASWGCVDFSYGSDPKFKSHGDPRKAD